MYIYVNSHVCMAGESEDFLTPSLSFSGRLEDVWKPTASFTVQTNLKNEKKKKQKSRDLERHLAAVLNVCVGLCTAEISLKICPIWPSARMPGRQVAAS